MLLNISNADPKSDYYAKKRAEVIAAMGGGEWSAPWPLPNAKLTDEKRFWGWRSSYGFNAEIWAGQKKVGGEWANLLVYYLGHSQFIDGGFAVLVFRRYQEERVEYYEWRACDHKFRSKNIGNCLNLYTCTKCGKAYEVDSSG